MNAERHDWMTHKEVAAHIRQTPSSLYGMRHHGDGPPACRVGKKLIYRRSDVDAWLESRIESTRASA